MSTFLPAEKGSTIRQPSVANLMIDSVDGRKGAETAASFQITQSQSIMNGFFTRIGVTEVVLEWTTPNVSPYLDRSDIDISGTGAITLVAPTGFYNTAQLINTFVSQAAGVTGTTDVSFSIIPPSAAVPWVRLQPTGTAANVTLAGGIPNMLGIAGTYPVAGPPIPVLPQNVELRLFRYLDFISPELTYNQDLKDNSTYLQRDVLTRWYMDYDQPPSFDAYGYPIMMGMTPFNLRRTFSPPKQIRWESNMPVGNLSFKVYPNFGTALAILDENTNWLMTLQFSEN